MQIASTQIKLRKKECMRQTCVGVRRGNRNREKRDPLKVLAGLRRCQPPLSRRLSSTGAAWVRRRFGAGSGTAHWRRNAKVSQGFKAQHFRKVRCRFRGRRSGAERSGRDYLTGDTLRQGVVYRCRGRLNTFRNLDRQRDNYINRLRER